MSDTLDAVRSHLHPPLTSLALFPLQFEVGEGQGGGEREGVCAWGVCVGGGGGGLLRRTPAASAGCAKATCVPSYEFHGNQDWPQPYSDNVTLIGLPITSYGRHSFYRFAGSLVVEHTEEKLDQIRYSSFGLAGINAAVKPVVSFVGTFPLLTEFAAGVFKDMAGELRWDAKVFALRTFKSYSFSGASGSVRLEVSSQRTSAAKASLNLLSNGTNEFKGFTGDLTFVSADCDGLDQPLTDAPVDNIRDACTPPPKRTRAEKEKICPKRTIVTQRGSSPSISMNLPEACCEEAGMVPCTRERYTIYGLCLPG